MANVILAGGTGFLGKLLEDFLKVKGHNVQILTRSPKEINHVFWNPALKEIDHEAINSPDIVINLCGQGIADKRWSPQRIRELYTSRLEPMAFIQEISKKWPQLTQLISASGIDCYEKGIDAAALESEDFGNDVVSNLVKEWEFAADEVATDKIKVTKLRISMVLHPQDGAMKKLLPMVNLGLGSGIGNGRQMMNWIHWEDLMHVFLFFVDNNKPGVYNVTGTPISNKEFMKSLAHSRNKSFWLPNVPASILKLMLGRMSSLLIKGRAADNAKLKQTAFKFTYPDLKTALEALK